VVTPVSPEARCQNAVFHSEVTKPRTGRLNHRHSERLKGALRLEGVEESLHRGHSRYCRQRFLDSLRSLGMMLELPVLCPPIPVVDDRCIRLDKTPKPE
jgi:hypothetical protein